MMSGGVYVGQHHPMATRRSILCDACVHEFAHQNHASLPLIALLAASAQTPFVQSSLFELSQIFEGFGVESYLCRRPLRLCVECARAHGCVCLTESAGKKVSLAMKRDKQACTEHRMARCED